jgi:hypothetical protein
LTPSSVVLANDDAGPVRSVTTPNFRVVVVDVAPVCVPLLAVPPPLDELQADRAKVTATAVAVAAAILERLLKGLSSLCCDLRPRARSAGLAWAMPMSASPGSLPPLDDTRSFRLTFISRALVVRSDEYVVAGRFEPRGSEAAG